MKLHLSDLRRYPLVAILCYPEQFCIKLGMEKEEVEEKKKEDEEVSASSEEWAPYLARWNKTLTAVSELRNSCWVLIHLGDWGKGVEVWMGLA